jgi:hypothetical protein
MSEVKVLQNKWAGRRFSKEILLNEFVHRIYFFWGGAIAQTPMTCDMSRGEVNCLERKYCGFLTLKVNIKIGGTPGPPYRATRQDFNCIFNKKIWVQDPIWKNM